MSERFREGYYNKTSSGVISLLRLQVVITIPEYFGLSVEGGGDVVPSRLVGRVEKRYFLICCIDSGVEYGV